MKKTIRPLLLSLLIIGLFGCSTDRQSTSQAPVSFFEEFQNTVAEIGDSGGLAAVGIGKSKSLALALNKAKTDGRIKLADRLETRTNRVPENLADLIQGLTPKMLEHETTNGIFTAYALMELNPQVLNQEIKTLSGE